MDDPMRHDLRRLAELNALTEDPELAPVLKRHRAARGRSPYRTVPYVAVAPEDGEELARTAMQVFRANHGSLLRTLGDPDLQVMHRLLGSDSPLQGELLSYLLFDPTSSRPPPRSATATPCVGSSTPRPVADRWARSRGRTSDHGVMVSVRDARCTATALTGRRSHPPAGSHGGRR
jgi:hypothetical protein